ncbi:MAG: hypothetical protein H6736_18975 [Alphaproteobacteria bacterium]|nr:hypothetical protein [Alphaproteobacteria bacterium]
MSTPTEAVARFLESARTEDEDTARSLSARWEPAEDGPARLFRQLSRRGTDGWRVGREVVRDGRAVVELEHGARTLLVFLEEGAVAAVREDIPWAVAFLQGSVGAQQPLASLPAAGEGALEHAAAYGRALVEAQGQVDGAPFNLRLAVKAAERLEPIPRATHALGDRFAACYTLEHEDHHQELWVVFERAGESWDVVLATEAPTTSDLLPGAPEGTSLPGL